MKIVTLFSYVLELLILDKLNLVYGKFIVNQLDKGRFVGIINGEPATASQSPWQFHLHGSSYCGGSIIHKRAVITAAHCITEVNVSEIEYSYGGLDRTKLQHDLNVSKIIIHPEWNFTALNADYAVVIFKEEILLSNTVQIIELADINPPPGSLASVTGWGFTDYEFPDLLQYTQLTVRDRDYCASYWKTMGYNFTKYMLCAYSDKKVNKSNVGGGDSGGPLVFNNTLIGVVSYGSAEEATFSDVAAVKPWIEEQIKTYI